LTPLLPFAKTYDEVYSGFRWQVPEHYNIGRDICDKWAGQRYRLALIFERGDGTADKYTFWELSRRSNRLANALAAWGVSAGDRVGVLLPQVPETALTHLAVYKLGAVAVPLFTLFGPDALEYRLQDSGTKAVVTDGDNLEKIVDLKDRLPDLTAIFNVSGPGPEPVIDFYQAMAQGSSEFRPVETKADDPALIIYTSGTTGPPKGALHAHRVVLGHVPGVEFFHNFFPREDDVHWTPADWAWIGGLIDVLLPSWHHGVPVVAYRAKKFDPEFAFHLMAKHGIRNAFLPPTALKMMRQVQRPRDRHDYRIRTIGSGGETLGEELLAWGRDVLGVTINEFYGQTEANLVVGNCAPIMDVRPGSMGRPIPGHVVDVVDPDGRPVETGQTGEIGVKAPDPVMFLRYWNNPRATEEKFAGDYSLTGDVGRKDEDGYIWFVGRKDDVITSAGYRIGPAEIEDCLIKHPAVTMSAVIGAPDEVRGEVVKAFIVLDSRHEADDALKRDIQQFVKTRLAAHEYPREIEFVDQLPMTATGKIMRRELRAREIRTRNIG
jgi:acetyl-CoA synthetase